LKAHYPIEFMAALLTSETGNTAKIVKYINECREMGIRVLPPDINSSDWNFTPDGEAIRFGLGAVKNIGQNAVESISKARTEVGRFQSLWHLTEHADLTALNRRTIESLIKAGAMDSLEGGRSQLFAGVERAMEGGQRAAQDRLSGQTALFGFTDDEPGAQRLPNVPDWTLEEKLAFEKEMLGFYVTGHPLDQFRDKAAELATHDSENVESLERGAQVALCGILTGIQRRRNREGKLWASMQIEDRKGAVDAMVFSTQFEALTPFLIEDKAVLVRGMALPEENAPPKISVQEVVPLEIARVALPALISIRVPLGSNGPGDRAERLSELFRRKPGDTEVRLRLEKPRDFSVVIDVSSRVRPDKEFRAELERICGSESLEVLAGG
jgi:DNA polymerase-3 subunit alpha